MALVVLSAANFGASAIEVGMGGPWDPLPPKLLLVFIEQPIHLLNNDTNSSESVLSASSWSYVKSSGAYAHFATGAEDDDANSLVVNGENVSLWTLNELATSSVGRKSGARWRSEQQNNTRRSHRRSDECQLATRSMLNMFSYDDNEAPINFGAVYLSAATRDSNNNNNTGENGDATSESSDCANQVFDEMRAKHSSDATLNMLMVVSDSNDRVLYLDEHGLDTRLVLKVINQTTHASGVVTLDLVFANGRNRSIDRFSQSIWTSCEINLMCVFIVEQSEQALANLSTPPLSTLVSMQRQTTSNDTGSASGVIRIETRPPLHRIALNHTSSLYQLAASPFSNASSAGRGLVAALGPAFRRSHHSTQTMSARQLFVLMCKVLNIEERIYIGKPKLERNQLAAINAMLVDNLGRNPFTTCIRHNTNQL